MIYNMIYSDGKTGKSFVKRFTMPGVTRDKEYPLGGADPNSRVHYLSANPNGEAEVVEVKLNPSSTARKKIFEFDFSELEVKGRGAKGNTLTKYPIRKVDMLKSGVSTLSGLELWFDESSGRLNKEKRGKHIGKFDGDDQILAITKSGNYKITNFEITNRYEPEKTILVEKFHPKKAISAVYWDGESKQHFVKRFLIETNSLDKEFGFISESIGSRLEYVTTSDEPEVELEVVKGKGKDKELEVINLEDIIDVKGWKAMGNRLSQHKVTKVKAVEEPEDTGLEEGDEENELVEAAETGKGSQSLKKKWETEEPEKPEQANLFGEPEKPKAPSEKQLQKAKSQRQVEQASLFGESQKQKPVRPEQPGGEKVGSKKPVVSAKTTETETEKLDGKAFGVGETIELEL